MRLALVTALCGIALWPSTAMAQEKIPALAFIPDNLSVGERAKFTQQRQALQTQLSAFQAAAKAFNDKTAENQTDAEFNSVQALRSKYISAANTFNRELSAAIAATAVRSTLPLANVNGSGEFYFVTKDGRKLTGAEAARLPMDGGTRAVTGANGRMQVLLPDETVFTLGPNSDMVIDDFVYDPATSATKATASFAKGTVRWVTGKVSHRKDINIKVVVGIIGVRGTDFEAMVKPSGAGYVKLFEGQLEIVGKKTGAKFILSAGQMITFTADGTFSQLTALGP
jgi:hypothetical protein